MSDPLQQLVGRLKDAGDTTAFVEADGTKTNYGTLCARVIELTERFAAEGVAPGDPVLLKGDFGSSSAAALLALWSLGAVVAPVAPTSFEKLEEFEGVARARFVYDAFDDVLAAGSGDGAHEIYADLRSHGAPGLVIFSSGTTGVSKGAVHNVHRLLSKFEKPGKDLCTLGFLLFDHIAGLDTLLYTLANASTIVCLPERTPQAVVDRIADHGVEVLPTAPSFLNVLLMSGAADGRDLSCLKIITYGAEMMPQGLLERVSQTFPNAKVIQKYGTSEIGALRSKSESSTSRWMKIDGDGTAWRVADGLLEIKTGTAMLGYLNAPSPFTEDGWYKTGDKVETNGDYIRFLGRESDMINVGGQKVFPAEVEAAIRELPGISDAAVFGKPHPMLGATVCAKVRPAATEMSLAEVRVTLRKGLAGVLEPYKIPQKIEVTHEALTTARFKQKRG